MDCDEEENYATAPAVRAYGSTTAVNSSVLLDYYKKFGKKRDLEQYFSLSTAQNEVKDTSGTFWQRMKSENDSSDSGGKGSDSSQELCRISIRCSLPDPCSSQEEDSKPKSESGSPPIIIEEVPQDEPQNSDDESVKSDGNHSQKSFGLDCSTNKPLSPSSSITSQRKLEWDSLADVGYANESDRKTSASSLSTLERLALKQQYSNNDTKLDSILEPTAHSSPFEENDKSKSKKGIGKKSTKIYKKDVDYLEVNVPHGSENNPPQTINVNMTKHISFNVEKDGKISVDNIQKDVSISPEKVAEKVSPRVRLDKEMQTSLIKCKDSSEKSNHHKIPVLISLNTLRRQSRRKKLRMARRKLRSKKMVDKENIPVQEKSGEQLSEAESFEYMPGHMYNQNQRLVNEQSGNTAGNKSSLESSAALTTDSSKGSKLSFTKDLEKSIDILKSALQKDGDDKKLRDELIKQVCGRLLKTKYRDDESSSEFLSGLSFSSKKLGLSKRVPTTTSTSDNSAEKMKRPKKSILRSDKFNSGPIASTSQSAPNLPTATNSEKFVTSNLFKNLTTSNTDSDLSHKEKSSSDSIFAKTSSQELYQKYLAALKREDNYKQHLKDKEMFLKQKLVSSDSVLRAPTRSAVKANNRLKDLIKDLTRNNYDDGSGDASKLEGGPNSSREFDRFIPPSNQRSHSVFTLSSGNSEQNKQNIKKRMKCDLSISKPGTSKEHYCCCPHHTQKPKACSTDSSVQVNIKRCSVCEPKIPSPRERFSPRRVEQRESPRSPRNSAQTCIEDTSDIKYVCLCNNKTIQDVPDNFMIFKCSRLGKCNQETSSKSSNTSCPSRNVSPRKNKESPKPILQCTDRSRTNSPQNICEMKTTTKSSQTNFLLKLLQQRFNDDSPPSCSDSKRSSRKECFGNRPPVQSMVYEATRWLQTEISINPRIHEPSLSDIKIVTDCANIVSEHCRVVSKPSLTDLFSSKQIIGSTRNSGSSKSSGTSKEIAELFDDDSTNMKAKTFETKNDVQSGSDCSEKLTIPVQGTNMTVMVSIGGNANKAGSMIGECIGTERSAMTEQSTSLAEECSKGVQYESSDLPSTLADHNCNIVKNLIDQFKTPNTVNTFHFGKNPISNTYPKTSPINEQKPLRRANTDTDNFGKYANPSQIHADRNKCEVNSNERKCFIEKETQCSKPNSPKCTCDCAGYIKDCDKNCDERKILVDSLCGCGCGGIGNCNKDCDQSTKCVAMQCVCGCYGDIDKCHKNRDERKKHVSTQCSCGCSGDINKCNNDCDERKKNLSTQCSCGCSNGECNGNCYERNKNASNQCPCGCCGDKDKCNYNCDERKKSVSTQCSCGCSNDKCSNCDEHKKSVANQCSCGCSGDKNKCNKICDELTKNCFTQCSCASCRDKVKCNKHCKKTISKEIGIQIDTTSYDLMCRENTWKPKQKEYNVRSRSCSPIEKEPKLKPRDRVTEKSSNTPTPRDSERKSCNTESFNAQTSQEKFSKSISKNGHTESSSNTPSPKEKYPKTTSKDCSTGNPVQAPSQIEKDQKPKSKNGNTETTSINTTPRENERKSKNCYTDIISTAPLPKESNQKSKPKDYNRESNKIIDFNAPSTNQNICEVERDVSSKCQVTESENENDPILEMIQNITKKYSKNELEKPKRKKCFKEIMTVLNYLLETDDTDRTDQCVSHESSTTPVCEKPEQKLPATKKQKSCQKTQRPCITESSDFPQSTDMPTTSSDSATCKVLNKIKKECERYHQKRCKGYSGKKCELSSSTSTHCEQCRRVHHCSCRSHKCKAHKKCEKMQKKSVAYNLVLQAAESISEETMCSKKPQLKNVIVKVPNNKKDCSNVPFQELCEKIKNRMPRSPRDPKPCRSRSLPNESEISSMEEFLRKSQACCTVREYLEQNRPDFIAKSTQRQDCLRIVSDSRANRRAAQRDLLSMRLAQLSDVNDLDPDDIRRLAEELGRHMRQKRPAPKFISERAMKKHSQNIYKSLPEVVQKKEEARKEDIRKTNLLMANIFRKNLQKKTLRGYVDISNYSPIIKI